MQFGEVHASRHPFAEPENVQPPIPVVYKEAKLIWEYKLLVRDLAEEETLSEDELNELGADGWELTGVFTDASLAHFYLKRLAP